MNNTLYELLKPLGYPVYWGNRITDKNFPMIIFNIMEIPVTTMDNCDEWIEYYITINVYANAMQIENIIKQINTILIPKNFRRKPCPNMLWDEKYEVYNKPLVFEYYGTQEY